MFLNEVEAKQMLRKAGISVTDTRLATSREEAMKMAPELGFPIVMKIVSPEVIHKSDAGGVKVNIKTVEDVGKAYDEIISNVKKHVPNANITGIAMQFMAPYGTEVIIGMTRDPQFGATLMFGLGGIFVEVLKDVTFRISPLTPKDASDMIKEIKGYKLLTGFRGQPKADIAALEDMLLKVSKFVEANPQIKELDLNPVFAYEKGAMAVDARIILDSDAPQSSSNSATEDKSTSSIVSDMKPLFYPESVAIVGASNRVGSFGQLFLSGFIKMGYKNVFPVHPREPELCGIKAYQSIKDIPSSIDLAILIIPQGESLRVVKECVEKGVKSIVLFAAGFREKSEEGRKLEMEIAQVVRQGGARMVGPNTNGLYSPAVKLLALPGSLTAGGLPVETGPLSVFSQSGSFNDYLCQVLTGKGIRFNKVVSCGNEADLSSEDFLEYYGQDSTTKIIASYLEGIKNGKRFFTLARKVSQHKPIIVWKGGLTDVGAKAALAHTGSLAGSQKVWEAMFKQTGIIGVSSFEEMTDSVMAFSWLPLPKGRRIALISGMGGTGVATSDNCTMAGLTIAAFSEATKKKLHEILPDVGTSLSNPLDLGVGSLMNPDLFGQTAKILADDENIDMIMAVTAPDNPISITSLSKAFKEIKKPVVITLLDIPGLVEPYFKSLLSQNIPTYLEPKRAAYALSKMAQYADFKSENQA